MSEPISCHYGFLTDLETGIIDDSGVPNKL
jgi:hypothetical protein